MLAESEQMRREADDIGPTAELTYWKSRMAKFNKYVLNLIKQKVTEIKLLRLNNNVT